MTAKLIERFKILVEEMDRANLKLLASLVNAELDRRRLDDTLDNISVRELPETTNEK